MPELEIRPLRASEIETFVQSSYYAFRGRSLEQRRADFAGRVTAERNILVGLEAGEIVSHVMIYEFAVWIGGARYPTGGLANVVTAPEKARRGYAAQMLRATLRWMREELGQCLSTLYPTVYPLYRGLGWALADDTVQVVGPASAFRPHPALAREPGARLVRRPAVAADVDLLAPVYEAFVRDRSGYLARPRWWWEARVLGLVRPEPNWLALWYGADGALAGYVVYAFDGAAPDRLPIWEVVATRPSAYADLLTFLASHNLTQRLVLSTGRDVPWRSLVADPHALEIEAPGSGLFMLRVVDFPRAIARRAVSRDRNLLPIALRVIDEHAPWNDGVWRLHAEDGRWIARGQPEARPDATADVATVSALFDGYLSVAAALDAGLLQADERAQPTLEALFACAYPPTSRDHF